MDGSYSELRDLAVQQDFVERLIMAVVDVAVDFYTTGTEQQKIYAVQAVNNPRSIAESIKFAVVYLADDDTDAKLKIAVNTVLTVLCSTIEVPV